MIHNPLLPLSDGDLERIHQTSLKLLARVGVGFPLPAALDLFKKHGFSTDGSRVTFSEQQVNDALATTPSHFVLQARNPDRHVSMGDGHTAFVPGYGAPFLIDFQQGRRPATLEDYHNLASLAHELPTMDISGHLLVEPGDVPAETAHLHMLLASIEHSDKVFMGSSEGERGARHTMEMAHILFGDTMFESPVTLGLVNSLSPLGYAPAMLEAIIEYARWRQVIVISPGPTSGSTGPISAAGDLALSLAEGLAAIVLTQLVQPGAAVIYGNSGVHMDMRTGGLAISSPEAVAKIRARMQLARHFGLPSRGGGAFTDANTIDAQAGFESMLNLFVTVEAGADLSLHAGGILSSFLAFSYEKFMLDDELCSLVRRSQRPLIVDDDTLAYDVIERVGPGNDFLSDDHTLKRCRSEYWLPELSDRNGLSAWVAGDTADIVSKARQRWQHLLAAHEDPSLDALVVRQLQDFVNACV